jgi:hypothetical protein
LAQVRIFASTVKKSRWQEQIFFKCNLPAIALHVVEQLAIAAPIGISQRDGRSALIIVRNPTA